MDPVAMRNLIFKSLCLVSLAVAASGRAQEPEPTPTPETRQAVNERATAEEQADFQAARDLESSGAQGDALSAYKRFIKKNPASPLAMQAQFRIAEILESEGESSKAFSAYQTLLTQYPDTPDFEKAVNRQVAIANDYLAGRKVKLLGFAILPGTERAEEMFASIIQNAPYSRNAPIAQFNLGLTYERQGRIPEAAKSYQAVLDRYPASAIADDALYQIGYIYMRLGEAGKSQDLSALVTAKNTFEDFLLQYPDSEKAPQARDNLQSLGSKESSDLLAIAQFYDRSKNHRAAAIYYNDVIRRLPDSEDATTARDRLQILRSEFGDESLRTGPEQTQTGETAALRRRLQAQVETSALADYNGPPRADVVAEQRPVISRPRLRTGTRDVAPLPAVEPALPNP
jgi:outer membrane protein assembly factor BamD